MSRLGYLGVDQHGGHYYLKNHPRKELMEKIGVKNCNIMYTDMKDGSTKRIGYVVGGLWISVYEIHEVSKWIS